jgi:uncharacterized membrane protein (GlpM family)
MWFLLLRGVASGALVIGVTLAARKSNPALSGLLISFPLVTIISLLSIGLDKGNSGLREVVSFNFKALPVWFAFIVAIFLFSRLTDWKIALLGASFIWLAGAGIYLFLSR